MESNMQVDSVVDGTKGIENLIEEIISSEELIDEPEDLNTQTPIHNKYVFWFHKRGGAAAKSGNYEDSILKVELCQTV
jgi:hypothetical protein